MMKYLELHNIVDHLQNFNSVCKRWDDANLVLLMLLSKMQLDSEFFGIRRVQERNFI